MIHTLIRRALAWCQAELDSGDLGLALVATGLFLVSASASLIVVGLILIAQKRSWI